MAQKYLARMCTYDSGVMEHSRNIMFHVVQTKRNTAECVQTASAADIQSKKGG